MNSKRSEPWKATTKYWCKYCKIYVTDNKPSRTHHEQGVRHKQSMQECMRAIRKRDIEAHMEQKEAKQVMREIEKDARKSYAKDLANAAIENGTDVSSQVRRPFIVNGVDYSGYGYAYNLREAIDREREQQESVIATSISRPECEREEEEEDDDDETVEKEDDKKDQVESRAPQWEVVSEKVLPPVNYDEDIKPDVLQVKCSNGDEEVDDEDMYAFKITTKELPIPQQQDNHSGISEETNHMLKRRKVNTERRRRNIRSK